MINRLTTDRLQPERATSGPLPGIWARLIWTLGHLLLLGGLYLLLYVGGMHVQIDYNRRAAQGGNDLPAPQVVARAPSVGSADEDLPAVFTLPVLNTPGDTGDDPASERPALVGSTISRIVIPSIAVDAKTIEVGWEIQQQNGQEVAVWQVAEYAVGHHQGSANPGAGGNIVLAGHVGGYGKVFRDLYYVSPGDQVILYSQGQQYLYVVREHLLVQEEGASAEQRTANARYIQPADEEVVTLVTCWPPTGEERFEQRVIIRAEPYGGDGNASGILSRVSGAWNLR